MKIAILGGAGAMGGLFGAKLAQAGEDTLLIDVAQDAVASINSRGLEFTNKAGEQTTVPIKATADPQTIGSVDLMIVFVKCYHVESAMQLAAPILTDHSIVLTLQNGWGNVDRISRFVNPAQIMAGVTYNSATVVGPGCIRHTGLGKTVIGELNGALSSRLGDVTRVLKQTGFEIETTDKIVDTIWSKLALNVCTLPTSGLLRLFAHQLVEHNGVVELMRNLLHETVTVAKAQQIHLDEPERWEAITSLLQRAKGAKASMLQDIENRKRTEIDVINGAVVEAGRRLGIPTPYNSAMAWLIQTVEASY